MGHLLYYGAYGSYLDRTLTAGRLEGMVNRQTGHASCFRSGITLTQRNSVMEPLGCMTGF
jgi:hypothetical protein